jgi:hypothetical protein
VTSASAGVEDLCNVSDLALRMARVQRRRGLSIACNGWFWVFTTLHVKITSPQRSWTFWCQIPSGKGNYESHPSWSFQADQRQTRRSGPVYNHTAGEIRRILRLARVPTGGGGDQGEFAENFAHPKPPTNSVNMVSPNPGSMTKDNKANAAAQGTWLGDPKNLWESEATRVPDRGNTGWALEVYKGEASAQDAAAMEAGMLKLDLDEEDAEVKSRVMAIAVFYSWKSYSPQYLFSDMMSAWGIQKLVVIENIGYYIFKLEFASKVEKAKVL